MKKYYLKKKNRISKKIDFKNLFKFYKFRLQLEFFTIIARNNYLNYSRLGIIIPKRYIKLSVNRNKIRRLIKENFRLNQEILEKNLDLIIRINSQLILSKDKKNFLFRLNPIWKILNQKFFEE